MPRRILLLDLDGTLLGSRSRILTWSFLVIFCWQMLWRGWSPIYSLKALHRFRLALEKVPEAPGGETNLQRAIRSAVEMTGLTESDCERALLPALARCFRYSRWLFFPVRGAREFLDWAKDHFDLVLATNPVWEKDTVLIRLGWVPARESEFRLITHARNMRACKPNVHYYRELLDLLEVEPAQCVMIGNDLRKDGPIRQLGVPLFLISQNRQQRERFQEAGVAAGSFEQLKQMLETERI